jgi:hypothetical protein
MRSERPCATTVFGDDRIPALATGWNLLSLGRNANPWLGLAKISLQDASMDYAPHVADFRYIVKRKMRPTTKIL